VSREDLYSLHCMAGAEKQGTEGASPNRDWIWLFVFSDVLLVKWAKSSGRHTASEYVRSAMHARAAYGAASDRCLQLNGWPDVQRAADDLAAASLCIGGARLGLRPAFLRAGLPIQAFGARLGELHSSNRALDATREVGLSAVLAGRARRPSSSTIVHAITASCALVAAGGSRVINVVARRGEFMASSWSSGVAGRG